MRQKMNSVLIFTLKYFRRERERERERESPHRKERGRRDFVDDHRLSSSPTIAPRRSSIAAPRRSSIAAPHRLISSLDLASTARSHLLLRRTISIWPDLKNFFVGFCFFCEWVWNWFIIHMFTAKEVYGKLGGLAM